MVTLVLLTNEEILQKNGFWYCLDNLWTTEDLEPFEEVHPEHLFVKPLSRDSYYTRYPDIQRSESEDETSITINGFMNKHCEWKTKIWVKQIDKRRNSKSLNLSAKSNNSDQFTKITKKDSSLDNNWRTKSYSSKEVSQKCADDKVKDFFNRLIKSIPPPPVQDLENSFKANLTNNSLVVPNKCSEDFLDIKLPDYDEFEKDKILSDPVMLRTTSTLKRKKRVSFDEVSHNMDFEHGESWYDSIYGVAEPMDINTNESAVEESDNENEIDVNFTFSSDCFENTLSFDSWSDIVNDCRIQTFLPRDQDNIIDEIISHSHFKETNEIFLDDEDADDETVYARFAIYKIYQTLKINNGMIDSSPLEDLTPEEDHKDVNTVAFDDSTFYGTVYRLVPTDSLCDSAY